MTKALTGVVQSGTATEALNVGHTVAGKSGTSNNSYAASFCGYTPSVVSVFSMWYPDANGNPQQIPAFGQWTGGSDYPVHLFTQYMKQALAGTTNEVFPTAKDNGKVGGSDGTWGTGYSSSYSYSYRSYGWNSTGGTNSNSGTTGNSGTNTNSGTTSGGTDTGGNATDNSGGANTGTGGTNTGGTTDNSGGTGGESNSGGTTGGTE